MTKGELYTYHKQITELKKTGNVIAYLLKSKIKQFYAEHAKTIDNIIRETQSLRDEFLTVDDKGKIVFDDKNIPVYKEGKTEYSFNMNWEALMQQNSIDKFTIQHYEEPQPEPVENATEA